MAPLRRLRRSLARLFKPTAGIKTLLVHIPPPVRHVFTFQSPSATSSHAPTQPGKGLPYLKLGRRLQLLKQIRARCEARIVVRLPPDVVVEEKEVEEEEDVGDAGDADLQAEQQLIFDSLLSESEAEAKCHRRQEAEAKQATEVDEMLAYIDEEEEPEPSYTPIY